MKKKASAFLILLLAGLIVLTLMSGCEESPTTLVVNITYDDNAGAGAPPSTSYLYLRLMLEDGTVQWSNENVPYAVANLKNGDVFRYVLTPSDAILTDPADMYMFDAYLYDAQIAGPAPYIIDPTEAAPSGTGDTERFTGEAILSGGTPYYNPAPHLLTGVQILPANQKHLYLTTVNIF